MITFTGNFYLNTKREVTINKILSKSNLIILLLGLLTLIVGYICLSRGPSDNPLSVTVAPLLLVLAYCVIIPVAIIKRGKDDTEK